MVADPTPANSTILMISMVSIQWNFFLVVWIRSFIGQPNHLKCLIATDYTNDIFSRFLVLKTWTSATLPISISACKSSTLSAKIYREENILYDDFSNHDIIVFHSYKINFMCLFLFLIFGYFCGARINRQEMKILVGTISPPREIGSSLLGYVIIHYFCRKTIIYNLDIVSYEENVFSL